MSEPPTAATGAEPGQSPPSPGAILQAARKQRGVGLGDVAEALRVMPTAIAAMEGNRFEEFGAPVYARGFLRKYAAFLGISADEILAAYDRLAAAASAPLLIPAAAARATRRDYSGLRLPAVFAAAMLLIGGSVWWWLGRTPAPRALASATPQAPAAAASLPAAVAPVSNSAVEAPATVPPPLPPAPVAHAPGAGPARPAVAPQRVATTAAATPASISRDVGSALIFRVHEDCWIEVYSPSGTRLLYATLRAGTTRRVAGPGPWRVVVGVLAGVDIAVGAHDVHVPASRRSAAMARFVVADDGAVR